MSVAQDFCNRSKFILIVLYQSVHESDLNIVV